jgi:hypothetical protein
MAMAMAMETAVQRLMRKHHRLLTRRQDPATVTLVRSPLGDVSNCSIPAGRVRKESSATADGSSPPPLQLSAAEHMLLCHPDLLEVVLATLSVTVVHRCRAVSRLLRKLCTSHLQRRGRVIVFGGTGGGHWRGPGGAAGSVRGPTNEPLGCCAEELHWCSQSPRWHPVLSISGRMGLPRAPHHLLLTKGAEDGARAYGARDGALWAGVAAVSRRWPSAGCIFAVREHMAAHPGCGVVTMSVRRLPGGELRCGGNGEAPGAPAVTICVVLLIGGSHQGKYVGTTMAVELETGRQHSLPPLLTPRKSFGVCTLGDGRLVCVGGTGVGSVALTDVEVLEQAGAAASAAAPSLPLQRLLRWRRLAPLRRPRVHPAVCAVGGRSGRPALVLVVGGCSDVGRVMRTCEVLRCIRRRHGAPSHGCSHDQACWEPAASLAIPRMGCSLSVVGTFDVRRPRTRPHCATTHARRWFACLGTGV